MAAVLSSSYPAPTGMSLSPRHQPSILLNPSPATLAKPLAPSKHIPNVPSSNSLASSSASSSGSGDSASARPARSQAHSAAVSARSGSSPSSKRIRFAPLPDPQRGVFVTDDGEELPLHPVDGDENSISAALAKNQSFESIPASIPAASALFAIAQSAGGGGGSVDNHSLSSEDSYTIVPPMSGLSRPESNLSTSTGTATPTQHTPPSSVLAKPKKFFKPFLKRSSSPCPPMSAGKEFSFTDLGLFRTESAGSSAGEGTGLARWTSTTSTGSGKRKGEWFGSPLARTESTRSYKGDVRAAGLAPVAASSSANGKRGSGTRMLNGRVYGGKRHVQPVQQKNPFANVHDDPEFIEWGYGGTGSVRASRDSGGELWTRVQDAPKAAEEEDDGGGMAWLRKRREAREREAKEKEERERKEREAQSGDAPADSQTEGGEVKDNPPTPPVVASPPPMAPEDVPTPTQEPPAPVLASPPADVVPAPAALERTTSAGSNPPRDEHHTTAVSVPAPSRKNSAQAPDAPDASPEPAAPAMAVDEEDDEEDEGDLDRGDFEDDEEEDEEETRATALGAGVEKISRHKDLHKEKEKEAPA